MLVPLVVLLVGMVVYVLSSNAKASEIGRILFFVGAFWLVALFSHSSIRFP